MPQAFLHNFGMPRLAKLAVQATGLEESRAKAAALESLIHCQSIGGTPTIAMALSGDRREVRCGLMEP